MQTELKTIGQRLTEIKDLSNLIEMVVNHYNMGLITISEKHNQIIDILNKIHNIQIEICEEYEINFNALNLMLTL
jgi:hypothetical protein